MTTIEVTSVTEKKRSTRLFDAYASNLASFAPQFNGKFMCPLCGRLFSRDSISRKEVTIEHIVPSRAGGRLTTLTCRRCNNRDGSMLERPLVDSLRVGTPVLPVRATLSVGEGQFRGEFYYPSEENPSPRLVGVPKWSDPRRARIAAEAIKAGSSEIHIDLSKGRNPILSQVALLRSAYLLMFRYLGYGYILHPCAREIRRQLANPLEGSPVLRGVFWKLEDPPTTSPFNIVFRPIELRSFFVILDLSTDITHYAGALLPGFDKESQAIYERLGRLSSVVLEEWHSLPYKLEWLEDPRYAGLPAYLWERWFSDRHG